MTESDVSKKCNQNNVENRMHTHIWGIFIDMRRNTHTFTLGTIIESILINTAKYEWNGHEQLE